MNNDCYHLIRLLLLLVAHKWKMDEFIGEKGNIIGQFLNSSHYIRIALIYEGISIYIENQSVANIYVVLVYKCGCNLFIYGANALGYELSG